MRKYLNALCKAIKSGRFNDLNYRNGRPYRGNFITTGPLFCSYGTIGFTAQVDTDEGQFNISCDREFGELLIDDTPWKEYINIMYLSENDISTNNPSSERDPYELETCTDSGNDVVFSLEKVYKKELQLAIDQFDINNEITAMLKPAYESQRVLDIKEIWEDYEAYLKKLQRICNHMPY